MQARKQSQSPESPGLRRDGWKESTILLFCWAAGLLVCDRVNTSSDSSFAPDHRIIVTLILQHVAVVTLNFPLVCVNLKIPNTFDSPFEKTRTVQSSLRVTSWPRRSGGGES